MIQLASKATGVMKAVLAVCLCASFVPLGWAHADDERPGVDASAAAEARQEVPGMALPARGLLAQPDEQRAAQVDAQEHAYRSGQIIVSYRPGTSGFAARFASVMMGAGETEMLAAGDAQEGVPRSVLVDVAPGKTVGQAVAEAELLPNVLYAQPNYTYRLMDDVQVKAVAENPRPSLVTDDPYAQESIDNTYFENQWWLYSVDAFGAWDVQQTNGAVSVAVLDTGINFEHKDLVNVIDKEHAYDAWEDIPLTHSPVSEDMAHGSHVAGIIAGEAGNGFGMAGVSYNARIIPICVFHMEYSPDYGAEEPLCSDAELIRAYEYLLGDDDGDGVSIAQETNLHAINMSLGGYGDDNDLALEDQIERAAAQRVVTVCAGGNGDDYGYARTDASWPSDLDACVAVTALASGDARPQWSDYNEFKDIAAPGVDIWSTWYVGDEYACISGTSMASPVVAGAVALLYARNPYLSADEAKDILYRTATDLGEPGRDDYYGHGKLNVAAAVAAVQPAAVMGQVRMVRTSSQQLEALVPGDEQTERTWSWSVDDPGIARVDDQGVLVAIAPGTVTVTVADADNPAVFGSKTVTVSDIRLPEAARAKGSPVGDGIVVSWNAAECAVGYDVLRADAPEGPFAPVGSVSADAEGALSYLDAQVEAGPEYYYQVVPVGMLDGLSVYGEQSYAGAAHYTDKRQLASLVEQAKQLRSATQAAEDGSLVDYSDYWVGYDEWDALEAVLLAASNIQYNSSVYQDAVDEAARSLADAVSEFDASRQPGDANKPAPADPQPRQPEPADPAGPGPSQEAAERGAGGDAGGNGSSSSGDAAGGTGAAEGRDGGTDDARGAQGEGVASDPAGRPTGQVPSAARWTRLWGTTALETMQAIVGAGFDSADSVVVATSGGYWDALSASALAGKLGAPVLLTDGQQLSEQTRDEIRRLGATRAYLVGGPAALSPDVESQVAGCLAGDAEVQRIYGENAQATAIAVADSVGLARADTCLVATSGGYWDALSASPYAYAEVAPIYLTDAQGVLAPETLAAISAAGYRTAIVVGGPAAVAAGTEDALSSAGVASVRRVYGADAYETSCALAAWEIGEGLSADGVGVATAHGYWDALTGAALCGRMGSVLVLADDDNLSAVSRLVRPRADTIARGFVFGGAAAVGAETLAALQQATAR